MSFNLTRSQGCVLARCPFQAKGELFHVTATHKSYTGVSGWVFEPCVSFFIFPAPCSLIFCRFVLRRQATSVEFPTSPTSALWDACLKCALRRIESGTL